MWLKAQIIFLFVLKEDFTGYAYCKDQIFLSIFLTPFVEVRFYFKFACKVGKYYSHSYIFLFFSFLLVGLIIDKIIGLCVMNYRHRGRDGTAGRDGTILTAYYILSKCDPKMYSNSLVLLAWSLHILILHFDGQKWSFGAISWLVLIDFCDENVLNSASTNWLVFVAIYDKNIEP